jgi:hypothetical protein
MRNFRERKVWQKAKAQVLTVYKVPPRISTSGT